jgi:hypothetical protein
MLEGQEAVFNEFEAVAIPLISTYNGQLLLSVRPRRDAFIESNIEQPYEIHLVGLDEERKTFLHLKEQSIKAVSGPVAC